MTLTPMTRVDTLFPTGVQSVPENGFMLRNTFFFLVSDPCETSCYRFQALTLHSNYTSLFSPPQIFQPLGSIFVSLNPRGGKKSIFLLPGASLQI